MNHIKKTLLPISSMNEYFPFQFLPLYADDTMSYTSDISADNIQQRLQSDSEKIKQQF
jgi:hypothetical protein